MVELVKQDYVKNKGLYNQVKKSLRCKIEKDVPIEHVGSTAIKDMIGKNIVDILIGVKNQNQLEQITNLLSNEGYFLSSYSKSDIYRFFASTEKETKSGDVHIHLVLLGTQRYNDFIILRNFLQQNKSEATAYSNFKKEIINRNILDRKEYKATKSQYVTNLIERARTEQNKDG